jgi:ABC-2 type transport system ATP-binding protein
MIDRRLRPFSYFPVYRPVRDRRVAGPIGERRELLSAGCDVCTWRVMWGAPQYVTRAHDTEAISVEGLTKRYGERAVVDDLSFTAPAGSVTGLLGPNGAGKTTTLRILLGLADADVGRASVLGAPYAELPHPGRQVGAVLETSGFHPGRTGADHLRLVAMQADLPVAGVAQALAQVELTDDADRRVGEYSLGMRQRLGLAGALLGDPEVVILDEPANGLDPAGVRWLREQLRALAGEGRAVLVSSHALAEVAQTVDRVVILRDGRLVAEDQLDALLHAAGPHAGATLEDVFFGLTEGDAPSPAAPAVPATAPLAHGMSPEMASPRWTPPPPPPPPPEPTSAPAPPPRPAASQAISRIDDDDELALGLAAVPFAAEPQVVAVCAIKGGVGCTTTALGLADALAIGTGRRVACVDGDPAAPTLLAIAGGDAGLSLDALADRADTIANAAELATCALRRPGYADVFGFPPDAPPSALGPAEYAAVLDVLRDYYEIVVVDIGDSPLAPLGAQLIGRAAHVVVATTGDRVATGVTASVLSGLDPSRATLIVTGEDDGAEVAVEATARVAHAGAAPGAAPHPTRRDAPVNGLTAGAALRLPFDRALADPPWNPAELGDAPAMAFKRLAWSVAEGLR